MTASVGREIAVEADGGGAFAAWLSTPAGGARAGLLLLPEIYNVNAHIRRVADRYAAEGYAVLAPDVFWRLAPGRFLPYTPDGLAEARALNRRLDVDRLVRDLGACLARLRAELGGGGKVGAVGFCLGGKLSWLCAARHRIDAAASYYGVRIETCLDEADSLSCPLLLHFAGDDPRVPPAAVAAIRARLGGRAGVDIHVYDGAGHGFDRTGEPCFHPGAAALAGERTLAHFAAHLR